MKAVILAGGYGRRMQGMCDDIPKPMIKLCGKPILQHQVEALRREGITDFVFVTHYLSDVIEDYFGNGADFGVNIEYFVETEPRGTGGSLKELNVKGDFLLCNGDLLFNFSLKKMLGFHKEKNALITLFTHPNSHPYDSTTVMTDDEEKVINLFGKGNKPKFYENLCNAGIQIVSSKVFDYVDVSREANFDWDIVFPCIKTGRVFSYKSPEYVFDTGTPERLKKAEQDLKESFVEKRHSDFCQKAVFLDRDGTINKYKGYITDPCQIELIDGAAQAINTFHQKGYLVIVITNQPVIARGDCSLKDLKNIHCRLEDLLAQEGAYLDDIFYCPHHPDSGFSGEIKELKIKCSCRKPGIGLIIKAKEKYNIDLSASYMVGDSEADIIAAKNSGCEAAFIGGKFESDYYMRSFSSLKEFSEFL